MKILCGGAGGMISGELTGSLLADGHEVVAVDIKPIDEWYQLHPDATNVVGDLSDRRVAQELMSDGIEQCFMHAAKMGGMGVISTSPADCIMNGLITLGTLKAAHEAGVQRFAYASSACVYRADMQTDTAVTALKEEDAWPYQGEFGYADEKIMGEQACLAVAQQWGMETRIMRYHNIYGPPSTWTGGAEKAPAAMCRKVAESIVNGTHRVEVWGDGEATRSFCWLGDCIDGTKMLMDSGYGGPVNIGSSELIAINDLALMVADIVGVDIEIVHVDGPQGVRGRNSENTLCREVLGGWEPSTPLRVGMERLYEWVEQQVIAAAP